MRRFLIFLVFLGLAGGGGYWWFLNQQGRSTASFRAAAVVRSNLSATISATGTIEPEEVVDIGAQVAGMIKNFGRDPRDSKRPIDYNTPVEAGTVLANVDDSVYRSQLEQAKANVKRAEADMAQLEAKVHQAERDWDRARKINSMRGAISAVDYDTAQATYEITKSALAVGVASIAQAKAAADLAEINLGYCTIKSPVKGVIIDRRVNVGQTVVSSLNAPSLFLIAKDLSRMQIWASVNEADIGQIYAGQTVRFTVDAYPDEIFQGEVAQIRLNATMTQNVVTYTVVVNTDNSHGKLKPYLTANLLFEVSQHNNVLAVPKNALRWRPQVNQVAVEHRAAFAKAAQRKDGGEGAARGTLWVVEGEFVRPVKLKTGLTDGALTEIVESELKEGDEVVVGISQAREGDGATSNPFTPQMFGGGRKQGP